MRLTTQTMKITNKITKIKEWFSKYEEIIGVTVFLAMLLFIMVFGIIKTTEAAGNDAASDKEKTVMTVNADTVRADVIVCKEIYVEQ